MAPVSDDGIGNWVTALPASEKDKFLAMVAEGEQAQVQALLAQRFRRESRLPDMAAASTGRAAEQAADREHHLDKLSESKDEAWQQVEKLTIFSKPKEYDQATQLLKDLHEIARRDDDTTAFTARVRKLRRRYAKRPSLMERFDKA